MSSIHSFRKISFGGVGGGAFVKSHDDVGSEIVLDFDGVLGSEIVSGAVEMGLELNAVFVDLDAGFEAGVFVKIFFLREGKNLIAAGVGENGPVPIHPFVEAAHFFDETVAGAEVEMISVCEDDFGIEIFEVGG